MDTTYRPQVLVAYGSRAGGTAEIAHWIARRLRGVGYEAEVQPASEIHDVAGFDAVVLGGALYTGRWHSAARSFARRHARALAGRPVWLFSSGPLDDSADHGEIPMVKTAAKAAARLGARGHRTFGGLLAPDAEGFIAAAMAKTKAGDFRHREAVESWADDIAISLRSAEQTV